MTVIVKQAQPGVFRDVDGGNAIYVGAVAY